MTCLWNSQWCTHVIEKQEELYRQVNMNRIEDFERPNQTVLAVSERLQHIEVYQVPCFGVTSREFLREKTLVQGLYLGRQRAIACIGGNSISNPKFLKKRKYRHSKLRRAKLLLWHAEARQRHAKKRKDSVWLTAKCTCNFLFFMQCYKSQY